MESPKPLTHSWLISRTHIRKIPIVSAQDLCNTNKEGESARDSKRQSTGTGLNVSIRKHRKMKKVRDHCTLNLWHLNAGN